jgi:hypothetical protein
MPIAVKETPRDTLTMSTGTTFSPRDNEIFSVFC